ncbi:hypothetical protein BJ912DRAFT_251788 [Pholiota molesta]|nr:hypothetical protein BJ912DRAFT_251788 [Pholiota molesta]
MIDLSGKVFPIAYTVIDGHRMRFPYGFDAGGRSRLAHYPEGTRGFFYFHSPADGRELHAGVRFRICESAAEFARGRDLLGTRGDVWGPKVLEMVKRKESRAILALSRAEQLIDEALIADLKRLDIPDKQTKKQITYITRAKMVRLLFPQKVSRIHSDFYPLTGSIKVQFELSNLPEHKELGPTLVVRVLDVVEPIAVPRHYKSVPLVPVPVPGMLLQRKAHGWRRPLAIPLTLQPMAEDLLALAKTTWV